MVISSQKSEDYVKILKQCSKHFKSKKTKKKYLASLGIGELISNYGLYYFYFDNTSYLAKLLYNLFPQEVIDYFKNAVVEPSFFWENGTYFLKESMSLKIRKIAINNYSLDNLIVIMGFLKSKNEIDLICDLRKNELVFFMKKNVKNGLFLKCLHNYVPTFIIDELISFLEDEDLLTIFKDNKIYNENIEYIYDKCHERIIKAFSNQISQDPDTMVDFVNSNCPKEVICDCLSKEVLNIDDLDKIIVSPYVDKKTKELIYKINTDKIDLIVSRRLNKNPYTLCDVFNKTMPDELILKFSSTFNSDIILNMYTDFNLDSQIKLFVFEQNDCIKQTLFTLIRNDYKIGKRILLSFNDSTILEKFVFLFPEDIVKLVFKYFPDFIKDKYYKTNSVLVQKILKNAVDNDPNYHMHYLFKDYSVNMYAFSLLSDNQVIDLLSSQSFIVSIFICNKEAENRCKRVIQKNFYEMKEKNLDKFFKIVQNIYDLSKDLFIFTITLFDYTIDEYLYFLSDEVSENFRKSFLEVKYNSFSKLVQKSLSNPDFDKKYLLVNGLPKDILKNVVKSMSRQEVIGILSDDKFVNGINTGEDLASLVYTYKFGNESHYDIVEKLIQNYNGSKIEFVKNFELVNEFLEKVNVNPAKFWQYSLNTSYNYVSDIVLIFKTDMDDFIKIYAYFIKHVFLEDNSELISFNLMSMIKNYRRYPELCKSIVQKKQNVSKQQLNDLLFLFNCKESYENLCKLTTIEDCKNVKKMLREKLEELIKNSVSIIEMKNFISSLLFNCEFSISSKWLNTYGFLKDLIQLEFNNRFNQEIVNEIKKVESITILLEQLYNISDINEIKVMAKHILVNFDLIINKFSEINYKEMMRKLYAKEAQANLTKITEDNENLYLNKTKTDLYGVNVYDFRQQQYFLYAHIISYNETVDDVVNGISDGNKNFISFSAITHRNQKYYYNFDKLKFGYNDIPISNYVCSSSENMSSNYHMKKNCFEFDVDHINQRGILDTSDSKGNSEILCFREGLKPKFIIVPADEEINYEKINIAKKYDLSIVLTQPKNITIDNPQNIKNGYNYFDEQKTKLLLCQNELLKYKKSLKKIAIFADSHALFEPTLAILEDARNLDVDEIYSLGDNIGTGPNPSEVLSLLKRYNVISLKGNHEKYVVDGLEKFREHLDKVGGYQEAFLNSNWTKNSLTESQLKEIADSPEFLELKFGDKKILLCHSIKDYNTNEIVYNQQDYDYVFQGHIHFKSQSDNVFTLRGAGVGSLDDKPEAYYIILHLEKDGLKIEERYVSYDINNTLNDINCVDNNTKVKIRNWVRKR